MKRSLPGMFSAGGGDDDAFKGDAGGDDALRARTHSIDTEESAAPLFSLLAALLIPTVATNSDPSLPGEVKFL